MVWAWLPRTVQVLKQLLVVAQCRLVAAEAEVVGSCLVIPAAHPHIDSLHQHSRSEAEGTPTGRLKLLDRPWPRLEVHERGSAAGSNFGYSR